MDQSSSAETKAAGMPRNQGKNLIFRFVREPLLHFLLLAVGLFVIQGVWGEDAKEVIVVDAETQKYLFKQEEDLRLRALTEDEKQQIVDAFVEEEILVREATARGFTDSSRIRALLLQNMRFFIGSDIPEPSEDELRAYFEANKQDFTGPPSIDLNHVMFLDPEQVPDDILTLLDNSDDPAALGDLDTRLGYNVRFLDQRRLVGMFGPEPAREILAIAPEDRAWRGPFEAPDGSLHFLRIARHNPPRTPEYEAAKNWIQTQWLSSKNRELLDTALSEMRENYLIEVQPLVNDSND